MKPTRLVYVPLEPYKERYTEYQSVKNGVIERQIRDLNVDMLVIRPSDAVRSIRDGVVLDVCSRTQWGLAQTMTLVERIMEGLITTGDVIYFEDFWHPGMEMIPYAMSTKGVKIPMYAFNYAQSVDKNDFTYEWRSWIKRFEEAWLNCLTGVFCACDELGDLMDKFWDCERCQVKEAVGLPYDHRVVWEQAGVPQDYNPLAKTRDNLVIYTSRLDKEKNPEFFFELVRSVMKDRHDIVFSVCTGAPVLRSNAGHIIAQALKLKTDFPLYFRLHTNQTKQQYYQRLMDAKVQFNCADQDWVSYTLLDATAFGCMPLYPRYLSFPDALHHNSNYMYMKHNIGDAKDQLYKLIDNPQQDVSWVYKKYERSIHRQLFTMGFHVPGVPTLREAINEGMDTCPTSLL